MKNRWIKLLLFLIPAVAGTIYCLWRFSPEQAIIRRADALFETVEKKTISLADGPAEKAARLRTLLAPKFEVVASSPIPDGVMTPEAASTFLEEFLSAVTACKVTRASDTVAFPTRNQALLQCELEVDVAVGRSSRRLLRYRCRLEYEKSGRDWLLVRVVLTPI